MNHQIYVPLGRYDHWLTGAPRLLKYKSEWAIFHDGLDRKGGGRDLLAVFREMAHVREHKRFYTPHHPVRINGISRAPLFDRKLKERPISIPFINSGDAGTTILRGSLRLVPFENCYKFDHRPRGSIGNSSNAWMFDCSRALGKLQKLPVRTTQNLSP